MRKWYLRVENVVDALSLRERGLVFLSGTAMIFLLWSLMLFDPQHAELEALQLKMQAVEKKLSVRAQEATVLAQSVDVNVDVSQERYLSDLKHQSAELDEQMSGLNVELIPPSEMLEALRQVLQQSNELSIERIEYLRPRALGSSVSIANAPTTPLFRHTVELTLEGGYFDLLEYLQALEALPWHFYWEHLSYQVSTWPLSDIELTVSTLSTSGDMFESD